MATEIERKFLVVGSDWEPLVTKRVAIRQGYLSSNAKATVRVRTKDDNRAFITLKGPVSGVSRSEYEYEIPISDGRELLQMSDPHVLEKHRHLVPFGELTWEVDVFGERHQGLVIAEVELQNENQHIEMPHWIGREVTDDNRYYNASLSRSDAPPTGEPTTASA
jgi:adenylate cyclase